MYYNRLALAVPLFLFFMGLEYLVAKWQKKNYFRFNNSVANLNVGIAERLLDSFTIGLFYFVYDYLHRHYALLDIRVNAWGWIGLFIATDFVWYWYHRLAHEINVFWAVHVVHHQSEDFNYTVSARITVFQAIVANGILVDSARHWVSGGDDYNRIIAAWALSVLYPHPHRWQIGLARIRVRNALSPPGSPRQ